MKSLREVYSIVEALLPVEDYTVKARLDRAYDIVLGTGYSIFELSTGLHKIYKASTSLLEDSSAEYYVDSDSCTCPDFEKARGGLCKHRIAVMLWKEMHA